MTESIFTRIARREADAHVVFETERVMAILDIAPAREGHTILFPKEPYQVLAQIPDETLVDLFLALKILRHATIVQDRSITGLISLIAQGSAAGQRAPHLIVHTIPRSPDDGLFPNERRAHTDGPEALAHVFERSDGLTIRPSDPAVVAGEVVVIDQSCTVFEELDASRIGIFASAVREVSSAVFEAVNAQGTNILIESGAFQQTPGALAHIVPRTEEDGLMFEWDPDPGADIRAVAERLTQAIQRVTRTKTPQRMTQNTNYLLKQLERLP